MASGILGVFNVSDVNKIQRTGGGRGATHIHTIFLTQTVLPLIVCAKSIQIKDIIVFKFSYSIKNVIIIFITVILIFIVIIFPTPSLPYSAGTLV